ncbi:unnamed protein product [Caenorhabditis auriculariae]|uniref:Uncharacterized protein n=1 Tax=Caenorhabditis auriculariae TaxID=2777116 RepID=A0A8S1H654_9PELO|nr:unnamed protein product [Caenorhabditis auriculariae]
MSKQLVVNGRTILVEEQDVDEVCAMFKENIIIDSEEGWRSKKEMEKYCASTFIDKARHYLSLAPPDLTQCSEKIWLAAVFAVKERSNRFEVTQVAVFFAILLWIVMMCQEVNFVVSLALG